MTTTSKTLEPTKKPEIVIRKEIGRSKDNIKDCYHKGRQTLHDHLTNLIESFCKILSRPGETFNHKGTIKQKYSQNVIPSTLPVKVVISFYLYNGYKQSYDYNECRQYLHVPIDSCNCAGVNDKQGGVVKNKCYKWRVNLNNKFQIEQSTKLRIVCNNSLPSIVSATYTVDLVSNLHTK